MDSLPQNSELKNTSWALHGLGFACVLCTGLSIYFFVIIPVHSQSQMYDLQAEDVVQFLQRSDEIQNENERLTHQVEQQQNRWDNLLRQIPETAEESIFLSQITDLSQTNNLKISSFSPGASRENDTCLQRDIQLTFTGTYLNLCQFLAGLDSVSRVTTIEHLTIAAPNQNQSDGNYMVTIHFNIAYQFKETKIAARL